MTREELLHQLICEQYGTVSRFADAAGVPHTTIRNIFTRGLGGVGADTVSKLCAALDVDMQSLMDGTLTARGRGSVSFDDFTYAMYQETKDLPEDKKRMLLDMARFFRGELAKEDADGDGERPDPV